MTNVFLTCLILLAVGLSLRMALKLLYGARGPRLEDPIYQALNSIGWGLILFPATGLLVFSTHFFSLFLGLVAMSTVVEVVLARRDSQRQAAWALLSGSLANESPTPAALRRHQGRFTGIVGRAFRRLVESLEEGHSLRTAVAENPGSLPRTAQAYAAINALGAKSALSPAPGRSFSSQPDATLSWHALAKRVSYLLTVLFAMLTVVTFFMIKIIPSYQAIFADFELKLPNLTVWAIAVSDLMVNSYLAPLLAVGLVAILIGALVVTVAYLCDIAVLRPLVDRLFFTIHRAQVLELLADSAENQRPFTADLQQLVHEKPNYPSAYVRRHLEHILRHLSAGEDWKTALAASSFIKRADIPLLTTAESAGNLPWVLRLLANQKLRRMLFRLSALEQVAFPAAVVMLGLVVGFICVALFIPLVNLIEGLA